MITQTDLTSLAEAARFAGFEVNAADLALLSWDAGEAHVPAVLPDNTCAVYIFKHQNEYIKVGKLNQNSNAR